MHSSTTTRTSDRWAGRTSDEASADELEAAVSRRLAAAQGWLPVEPGWLCEAFDAAWAWLLTEPPAS